VGSRKRFMWLGSAGALGLIIVVKNTVPGFNLALLLSLLMASFGLLVFASPLGPFGCRLEKRLIDRTRSRAARFMGPAMDSHWAEVVFKPVFTSPALAARIIRLLGAVLSVFAAVQIYTAVA